MCFTVTVTVSNPTVSHIVHQNFKGTTRDFGYKTLKMKQGDTQVRITVDLSVMVCKAKREVYMLTCTRRKLQRWTWDRHQAHHCLEPQHSHGIHQQTRLNGRYLQPLNRTTFNQCRTGWVPYFYTSTVWHFEQYMPYKTNIAWDKKLQATWLKEI